MMPMIINRQLFVHTEYYVVRGTTITKNNIYIVVYEYFSIYYNLIKQYILGA